MATTDRARAAVARRSEQGNGSSPTLAQYFHSLEPEMARALPKHMPAERMARIALTTVRRDKSGKLARCSPESFAGALLTAAQLGLEVGNDEAYLVPYAGEVTLIIGYQGYAKLFWQSPLARHLDAQAVYQRDEFEYEYGLNPRLVHRPAMVVDRGPVIAFYAVAALSTGGRAFVVLSPEQVKALRDTTRRPDVRDPMLWMERKTALRQLFKLLPKSAELNAALAADEQVRTDLSANVMDSSGPYIDVEPDVAIEATPSEQTGPPAAAPVEHARGITEAQLKKLHATFGDLKLGGDDRRDDRLAVLSALIDRSVGSSSDLSLDEARIAIDFLEPVAQSEPGDQQTTLGGLAVEGRKLRADGGQ